MKTNEINKVKELTKELEAKDEVIPCLVNPVFKSIFSDKKMEGVLSYIIVSISDLTEDDVYGNLDIVDSYEPVNNIVNKQNTHDLKVRINNSSILLEMNNYNRASTRFRNSAHYHAGIVNQIERATDIENLGKVIQISFDNEAPFSDDLISTIMMMDIKTHQIDNSERNFKKYRINLSKVRKLGYNVDKLSRFKKILLIMTEKKKSKLRELAKGDKELEYMVKKLEKISKNPDFVSYYNEETLDKIGRQLDIEEATTSGFKEGRTSGFEDGVHQKSIETAKKMLKDKLDLNLISKYTNLSIDEIKNIGK